eukprot:6846148-Alexandrium_andersonii.AAC.1
MATDARARARACASVALAQELGRVALPSGTRPGSGGPQRLPAPGWLFPGVSGYGGCLAGFLGPGPAPCSTRT